ncbi:MAG TPA: hypothetical protein VG674_31980 [Amycolatopsis sp.]|nr:hypothetical protein [Amycolatopsis sp.]
MSELRTDREHQGHLADREPVHEVTWWGNFLAALLGRTPRAKCGASLEGDPGEQIVLCPRCVAR